MVRAISVLYLVLLSFGMKCLAETITRKIKATRNAEFQNKKVTEEPMETLKVKTKIGCIAKCKETNLCSSFFFNDDSKDCCLYNRDFIDIKTTQTTDEIGWNYYHLVPARGTINISKCELQGPTVCQGFCFFYRNDLYRKTREELIKVCSNEGGEVIKIDRYLKQYCMEQAVDTVIGKDSLGINGMQDKTIGDWTYFDGTKMSHINWDKKEPGYVSAKATPGTYEGLVGTGKVYNYLWHDVQDWWITAVLCEIT